MIQGYPPSVVKALILTRYGRLGASSRIRALQYLPFFQKNGIQASVHPLLSDQRLAARYQSGGYGLWSILHAYFSRCLVLLRRHHFDVIWIEKEALPWWPLWLEMALLQGVPYVLDYDDAIFHNYDQHHNFWIRRLFGYRLDKLMAKASLVIGGNNYLAQRARDAGAPWVEVLPTVIDLERYPARKDAPEFGSLPRIVWIGSPATDRYLQLLREPLQALAKNVPFTLRVIGGGAVDMPGVAVEIVPWSEDGEVESIRTCDIGVMPLFDSPWERGKCGYKLIQYMACGLPVVASNVGVNPEIVRHGENGFLVSTSQEWVAALGALLEDGALRTRMGWAGRQLVERTYCIQQTAPKMVEFLRTAAARR